MKIDSEFLDKALSEKVSKTLAVRITEDAFLNIKAIQYIFSNDFGTPHFSNIVKVLLEEKIAKLKEESKTNPELRKDFEDFQKLIKEKQNLDFNID